MYPEYKLGWFLQLFMFQVPSVKFFLNRMESNSIKFSVSLLCFFLFIASLILCSSKFTAEFLIYFPRRRFLSVFLGYGISSSFIMLFKLKNCFGHNINYSTVLRRHYVPLLPHNSISDIILKRTVLFFITASLLTLLGSIYHVNKCDW